ncbi:MAG: GNAT family N-acetyltransferase [bacterium]
MTAKKRQIISFERDARVAEFLINNWGDDFIVSDGKILCGKDLPGFMILEDENIIGLLTYHIENNECEIVSLDALLRYQGIGTTLVAEIINKAVKADVSRLWLMTTNDNINAMRFYQKRGFLFTAVHKNAIEKSRQLKQSIPELGSYGIPIRDEIELEYPL